MKSIRKSIVFLLVVLMAVSTVLPAAFAEELADEDELIRQALAQQEETEEPAAEPVPEEPAEAETPESGESTESTEEEPLDGGEEPVFVWQTPGSRDLDILAGGTMLTDGSAFY